MVTKAFAVEDAKLDQATLVTSRKRLYKDVDLEFNIKTTGDIYRKTDAAAVKQAVKNLLLTNFGEKPFDPSYGANLRGLLFELADEQLEDSVEIMIREAIRIYEPRAAVIDVTVKSLPDYNSLAVQVTFSIVNTTDTVTLQVTIARLR